MTIRKPAPIDEQLPVWHCGLLGLAVTVLGAVPFLLLAVHGGAWLFVGLTGMIAAGIAGMTLIWHLPPADLAVTPAASRQRPGRQGDLDARRLETRPGSYPCGRASSARRRP